MPETRVVGQRLPRMDAEEKVRGEAIFAPDVRLPGMLVGKCLPSSHAHAEILSIDTSQAEALPGVRAVITAADIPIVDGYEPDNRHHAFLARRFALFAGQAVAAVAADDLATAEAALDRIGVEYRPLPVVHNLHEAIRPDSPAVSREAAAGAENQAATEERKSPNVVNPFLFEHGDTVAAFAASDVVVEGVYTVPALHQGYLEPHAVTAHWDRPDHVTVWQCVQGAFGARDLIAKTLGIPHTQITMNTTEIGGGFGGKDGGLFAPLAILLAQKARRPVQLVLTRQEELIAANPAPCAVLRLKTGARQDGTLTALEAEVLLDVGAFSAYWDPVVGILWLLGSNYRFQAWRLAGQELLTNRASVGAYRAPGAAMAAFATESQMDEIARRLGLDPLAFRLQNVALEGDPLPNLQPQVQSGAKEVLAALARHPAWTSPPPPRQGDDGLLHGRGLALGSWGAARGPASAVAILEAGGQIRIVLGTVDLTGSFTSLAQIAAEALGVSAQQIVMSKASPDHAPYAPISGGSQTIYAMGSAVKAAALDLRAKILACAAQELAVPEAELEVNDEGAFVAVQPERSCSFQKLYQLETEWAAKVGPLVGLGSTPLRQPTRSIAVSVAEVAVDRETGRVTLTRLTTAQDVGKAINPLSVEGQIQGAAAQSAGMALWEELMIDEEGQVLNPRLLDYRMPTAADLPMIETIVVETEGGDGPHGAKGVGEPPMVPPAAAVANAVAAALGTRIYDLPITPERVWRTLKESTREMDQADGADQACPS
jgi:CO/xanthine dehydrogenase Mo-binding subunit